MNRQKREEALRKGSQSGKSADQPGRSGHPHPEQMRGTEDKASHEAQKPQREPGKLPLPE